jgi:hypothetical protein
VHYDRVAKAVPADTLADGVAHALRSDQTPVLGQMVRVSSRKPTARRKAGMLNHLMALRSVL